MEGDQMKMREALLEARRFVWASAQRTDRDLLVTDDEKRGPYGPYVLSPKDTLAKIDAALSAPARNCDLYKNKKDAEAAFISEKCKHPCGNCTVDDKYGCALVHECGVDWLFATAERKGEGK